LFYGKHIHALDSKSRVFVPSKFREELGSSFIITKGLDTCLFAFTMAEWANVEQRMKNISFTDNEGRSFMRFLFAGAAECEVDKQGRILIPQDLKEYANLDKEICIVGLSNRIEIWDKNLWDKQNSEGDRNAAMLAKRMAILGI